MKLTPLDIRHKEFKRGMRGYADVEVDEFLDEIADEFERLFKDNIDLGEHVEALESQVAGYRRIEETLQKTLVSAQASAEELRQNSSKEAQLILHEAELKGRQLVNEAYSERQAIEQSMAKLKSAEQDFRFKFRQMLEGYLRHLEEAQSDAPGVLPDPSAQAEFARHAEAVKQAIAREESPVPAEPEVTAEVPASALRVASTSPAVADEAPGGEEASSSRADLPAQPGPGAAERPTGPARILFGETDDLLADVDSGVNEDEFKW
jgi:cell division initiation protein